MLYFIRRVDPENGCACAIFLTPSHPVTDAQNLDLPGKLTCNLPWILELARGRGADTSGPLHIQSRFLLFRRELGVQPVMCMYKCDQELLLKPVCSRPVCRHVSCNAEMHVAEMYNWNTHLRNTIESRGWHTCPLCVVKLTQQHWVEIWTSVCIEQLWVLCCV